MARIVRTQRVVLDQVELKIETDKDGYMTISTDGYTAAVMNKLIAKLRTLQTPDDLEDEELLVNFLNAPPFNAWQVDGVDKMSTPLFLTKFLYNLPS